MGHQRRISLRKLIAPVLAPNFRSGPLRPRGSIFRGSTRWTKRGSASEQGGTSNFASRLIGQREVIHTTRSRTRLHHE